MFITTPFFYNGSLGGCCINTLHVLYLINAIIGLVNPTGPLSCEPRRIAPNLPASTRSGGARRSSHHWRLRAINSPQKPAPTCYFAIDNRLPPPYLYSDSFFSVRILPGTYEKNSNCLANGHEVEPRLAMAPFPPLLLSILLVLLSFAALVCLAPKSVPQQSKA